MTVSLPPPWCLQAEVVVNYHVGETVLSLQKTTLIPGGSESLVYTTLSGGIGILVPFTSHEVISQAATHITPHIMFSRTFTNVSVLFFCVQDHDFFQHLEMHMRSEFPPLCGRDHLSFRSYYFPVKVFIFLSCFYMYFHLLQTCIFRSPPVGDLQISPESSFFYPLCFSL